jgi:hypothetical protein
MCHGTFNECSVKQKDFQFPTCSLAFPGPAGRESCLGILLQIAAEAEAETEARQWG